MPRVPTYQRRSDSAQRRSDSARHVGIGEMRVNTGLLAAQGEMIAQGGRDLARGMNDMAQGYDVFQQKIEAADIAEKSSQLDAAWINLSKQDDGGDNVGFMARKGKAAFGAAEEAAAAFDKLAQEAEAGLTSNRAKAAWQAKMQARRNDYMAPVIAHEAGEKRAYIETAFASSADGSVNAAKTGGSPMILMASFANGQSAINALAASRGLPPEARQEAVAKYNARFADAMTEGSMLRLAASEEKGFGIPSMDARAELKAVVASPLFAHASPEAKARVAKAVAKVDAQGLLDTIATENGIDMNHEDFMVKLAPHLKNLSIQEKSVILQQVAVNRGFLDMQKEARIGEAVSTLAEVDMSNQEAVDSVMQAHPDLKPSEMNEVLERSYKRWSGLESARHNASIQAARQSLDSKRLSSSIKAQSLDELQEKALASAEEPSLRHFQSFGPDGISAYEKVVRSRTMAFIHGAQEAELQGQPRFAWLFNVESRLAKMPPAEKDIAKTTLYSEQRQSLLTSFAQDPAVIAKNFKDPTLRSAYERILPADDFLRMANAVAAVDKEQRGETLKVHEKNARDRIALIAKADAEARSIFKEMTGDVGKKDGDRFTGQNDMALLYTRTLDSIIASRTAAGSPVDETALVTAKALTMATIKKGLSGKATSETINARVGEVLRGRGFLTAQEAANALGLNIASFGSEPESQLAIQGRDVIPVGVSKEDYLAAEYSFNRQKGEEAISGELTKSELLEKAMELKPEELNSLSAADKKRIEDQAEAALILAGVNARRTKNHGAFLEIEARKSTALERLMAIREAKGVMPFYDSTMEELDRGPLEKTPDWGQRFGSFLDKNIHGLKSHAEIEASAEGQQFIERLPDALEAWAAAERSPNTRLSEDLIIYDNIFKGTQLAKPGHEPRAKRFEEQAKELRELRKKDPKEYKFRALNMFNTHSEAVLDFLSRSK